MVSPAGTSAPGAGTSANSKPTPQVSDDPLEMLQTLLGLVSGADGKKKPPKNSAAAYIRGNGAFTIRPLGEQVKVRDAKQGEADYWSALGYNA